MSALHRLNGFASDAMRGLTPDRPWKVGRTQRVSSNVSDRLSGIVVRVDVDEESVGGEIQGDVRLHPNEQTRVIV